jgi:A/G-specific adenine glycosylase
MAEPRSLPGPPFATRVIEWQQANGRHDLPWQQSRDAYRVWLSEIMLQQTQVLTVIPYYGRFLARFPTLEALAEAPLESVLELWSGLGYYARARNLHRCAQTVVAERAGKFSADPAGNLGLPGVGRSTAAAISVFAFGRRAAILDGNVKRVLGRCFGIEVDESPAAHERRLWALAESLLPETGSEAYTQGLMDLGATLCRHRRPACDACPLQEVCVACRDGRQADLPRPPARKALPERESHLLWLSNGRRLLVERRPPSGIWGGLLSLPEVVAEAAETFALRQGCRLLASEVLPPLRHAFTHFRLTMTILRCEVEVIGRDAREAGWEWLSLEKVATAALPTPIRKLLLSSPRSR